MQCFVKNNVAYVNIAINYNPKEEIIGWAKIVGNLPIPAYNGNLFVHFEQTDSGAILGSMITKDGNLMIIGSTFSSAKFVYEVISYPIA